MRPYNALERHMKGENKREKDIHVRMKIHTRERIDNEREMREVDHPTTSLRGRERSSLIGVLIVLDHGSPMMALYRMK